MGQHIFIDPTKDHMQSIRDAVDAREASDAFHRALAAHQRKHGPVVGGRRNPRAGQSSAGYPDGGCASPRQDAARCTTTPQNCHASILGFNSVFGTVAAGAFPLVGANASATLRINAGNAGRYRPSEFFFEARDSAAGFGAVPCLLVSAFISGSEQLVSTGNATGIPSAVFALTNEPLPVNWNSWSNSGQQQLDLQFTNFLAVGVTIHVFGCFWGDRMPDPSGGNQ